MLISGGACTSHLIPPTPRFRLLLRLPQKRQVTSQLLDYLAQIFPPQGFSFSRPCRHVLLSLDVDKKRGDYRDHCDEFHDLRDGL